MAWNVELSENADRQLGKLDAQNRRRISRFLHERAARLGHPRAAGKPWRGSRLGEFWRYRVGDYRLIGKIENERLIVLVLVIGHRREVYP